MKRTHAVPGSALVLILALSTTIGSASAASTATPFVVGEASASSQVISVSPAISGYSLGVETGVSIATYHGTDGQGQAQLVTSALLGAFSIPLPVSVSGVNAESSSTPTSLSSTLAGNDGEGGGVLGAMAGQSAGSANASLASFSLPSALNVNGGQSTATTDLVNGATREAVATSTVASISLLGGLVTLNGLHWTATDSTGATPVQAATFAVGSIGIGGSLINIPADGLTSVLSSINQLLAATGIHLTLPTQQIGSNGSVQETPLSIGLDNSALGKELVSPFIGQLQPLRTLLNTTLTEIDNTLGETDLVLEIGLSILAGEGTLDLNLGGAYAESDGVAYANPLTGSSSSSAAGSSDLSSGFGTTTSSTDNLAQALDSLSSGLTTPTTTGGNAFTGSSKPTKLSILSTSSTCESVSVGGCRSSHSLVILITLLALTFVLLGFESLRMRRRKRLLIPEDT
jgi:hypothetical protein